VRVPSALFSSHDSIVRTRFVQGLITVAVLVSLSSCTGGRGVSSATVIPPKLAQTVSVPRLDGLSVHDTREQLSSVGLKLGMVRIVTGTYTEGAS
jgi:hypothetical protein